MLQKLMTLAQFIIMIFLVNFVSYGQIPTSSDIRQDTEIMRNAIKLTEVDGKQVRDSDRIDKLAGELSDLRIDMSSAKSAVYGFGLCLTVLQALQVLAAFKKPKVS